MDEEKRPTSTTFNTVQPGDSGRNSASWGGIPFVLGAIVVALGVMIWLMVGNDDASVTGPTTNVDVTVPAADSTATETAPAPDATAPAPDATAPAPDAPAPAPDATAPATTPAPAP